MLIATSNFRVLRRPLESAQYVSITNTQCLAEASIEPSVGSVEASYDNALAEAINGLYKAEVAHPCGPWRGFEAVKLATLQRIDWFNSRRLLGPIGDIPPVEAEARHFAQSDEFAKVAWLKPDNLRQTRGGSNCDGGGRVRPRPQR